MTMRKRYAKVHFHGDIFKPNRTYEYYLPEGEIILSGMHVIVPVGPGNEEMTATVVSRHNVRRYWFGATKTILRRAPRG